METLLECAKFRVVRRRVRGRDGRTFVREVIVHPGAVVILPILEDGRIVMIRNRRHTIERELLELPAGTLDQEGEDAATAAHRELEEETGYRAGRMERLCELYPSPGVMTERIQAYVATSLTRTQQRLEPSEDITVECMTADEALAGIRRAEIVDAKTMVALLYWNLTRRGEP